MWDGMVDDAKQGLNCCHCIMRSELCDWVKVDEWVKLACQEVLSKPSQPKRSREVPWLWLKIEPPLPH